MRHQHFISIDASQCIGCGLCAKDCTRMNIRIEDKKAQVLSNDCLWCAHCVAICPQGAVSISGFEDQPEQLTNLSNITGDDVLQLIKRRRSVRHFQKDKPVPEDILQKILQAGQYTPSAANLQGVSYVVLRQHIADYEQTAVSLFRRVKKVVGRFVPALRSMRISDHFFFKGAPLVIVVKSNKKGLHVVDGALAAEAIELTAQAYGLGVLFSGFFTMVTKFSRELKKKLGVKKGEKVIMTLVIGYPALRYQRTAPKERPEVLYD